MKDRPVKTAGGIFLPAHRDAEQALEKIGLELRDNREGAHKVENRRVMLHDRDCTVFRYLAFAHVAIAITQAREPFRTLTRGFTTDTLFVIDGELLIDNEQQLFRRRGSEEFLRRHQYFERQRIARGREKLMGALREAVEFEGPAPGLRLAPRIQQARVLHLVAQFLHPHVRHVEPGREFAGVHALASLEFIENFQASTTGDGFEKTLFQWW